MACARTCCEGVRSGPELGGWLGFNLVIVSFDLWTVDLGSQIHADFRHVDCSLPVVCQ